MTELLSTAQHNRDTDLEKRPIDMERGKEIYVYLRLIHIEV